MRDALIIALLALLAIVIGAALVYTHGGPSLLRGGQGVAAVAVPYSAITSGVHSSVSDRVNYLITSEDELNRLWALIDASGTPPMIDFTKYSVIGVFAGEEPTTGYSISVSKVEDSGSTRMVHITLMRPAQNCIEGQIVTSPFTVLKVPSSSLTLTHDDTVATTSCGE